MKQPFNILLLLLSIFLLQACGNDSKDSVAKAKEANEKLEAFSDTTSGMNAVNEKDAAFLVEVASAQMMEIEMGNLAQQKAHYADVKSLGEMMVKEHSELNQELKNLASLKNVTLPVTMGDRQQKHVDQLRQKADQNFDQSYISIMVKDHERDVKQFEKAANDAQSPDVKSFAAKTLPMLRIHLDSAKAILQSIK